MADHLALAEETYINFNTLRKWLQRRNMAAAIQPVQLAMLACASRRAQRERRIGHALTAWRRQQGARHRQRSRGGSMIFK